MRLHHSLRYQDSLIGMDKDTLNQFLAIARVLRRKIYSVQMPQAVILDLDSTLLDAYGRQQPDFVSLYPYLSSFC